MHDDLMPLDGEQFNAIEELDQEIRTEKTMVQAAGRELIAEILTWFDSQIATLDSIEGLDPESPVSLEQQVISRQLAKASLVGSRNYLENLKSAHIKG